MRFKCMQDFAMLAVASLVSCESEREIAPGKRQRTENVLPINCRNSTERDR